MLGVEVLARETPLDPGRALAQEPLSGSVDSPLIQVLGGNRQIAGTLRSSMRFLLSNITSHCSCWCEDENVCRQAERGLGA